ncbi:hypothetical protein [Methylobacterium radiotolerans]|uniref:hypothetical protein n=1 Tax=Methylobacterium radiotolerans TaxID=31998 RepID=UPI0011BE8CA7|nr:hypothetical protein [Methylobacterium radiotolerans]
MPVSYEEMPQPLGLFASDLYQRGSEFLSAANLVFRQAADLSYPGNYLLAHALELLLKSHLASCGTSKQSIKKLGHDLTSIFTECISLGLPKINKLPDLVEHISVMNSDHDFRYPTGFDIMMPVSQSSVAIVGELKANIGRQVETARAASSLKFAADTRHLRGKKVRWSD